MITPAPAAENAKKISSTMYPEKIKQLLQKIKPKFPHPKKLDLLWKRYLISDRYEKADIEQQINKIAVRLGVDDVVDDQIILPPPADCDGDISIGNITYLDEPKDEFKLKFHELTRHLGIFGYTGTGKTTLAINIIRDLIKAKIPVLIIDWEKSYRSLAKEFPEMKVYTIGKNTAPFRFNFFKVPPGVHYEDYVKDVVGVFSRAYIGGAGVDNILRKIFDQAYQYNQTPTLEEIKTIVVAETKPSKMRGRAMNWKQTAERMIQFLCYGITGIAFNTDAPEGIIPLLEGPVILELEGLGNEGDKQFTVQIILLWYWHLLNYYGIEHESLKRIIVLEEFHRVADNPLIKDGFRMMRKYGTGFMAIDQMPSEIPKEVFENMGTKVTFALQENSNIKAIASSMFMDKDQPRNIGLLQKGQAIMRCQERYPYPFMITVPFTGQSPHITDQEIRDKMKPFSNLSTDTQTHNYTKPPLHRDPTVESIPSSGELIMLQDIAINPYFGTDERYKNLGLTAREGNDLKEKLIQRGFLDPASVDRKTLYALTDAAKTYLATKNFKIPPHPRGGIEHNYWLEKVRKHLAVRGFAFREYDDIDIVSIELQGTKETTTAVQVETGKSNIRKNIETLLKGNFNNMLMLATTSKAEMKIHKLINESNLPEKERIQILTAKKFLS